MVNCIICSRQFTLKKNLYAHIRKIHNVVPVIEKNRHNNNIVCSSCSCICPSYSELRDHLILLHGYEMYIEEITFQSKEDFLLWKESKEKKLRCSYVQVSGTRPSSDGQKTYYICHRSSISDMYKSSAQEFRTKSTKSQGSAKLNNYACPSTMELVESNQTFRAKLFLPHVGHECTLSHLNLTKMERTTIAGKISEGVSFDRILDDIRNTINSEESLGRICLLDRQDLRNIKKQFGINNQQYHKDDVISVDLWIKHMQTLADESPVLYYKRQQVEDESTCFEVNDFFLALMTTFQMSLLKKFGCQKICVDSTHGTNAYDFLLTTVMTVDEFGEGVPVAFLLSNKTNTAVLSFFFNLLKDRVGNITTEVFMSDDAPEFINAWTSVMGPSIFQLLCAWHVDRNWRGQLQKIQGDQELRVSVYKLIRVLMETQLEEKFNILLNEVLTSLYSCNTTKSFGEYFELYYARRARLWAYCYRKGLGLNTNMYLESMHKTLKHIYLEGKKCKRVDKCLNALMKLIRDIMFKRLKKTIKSTPSFRMKLITASHLASKGIKEEDIEKLDENSWTVKSQGSVNSSYTISKMDNLCLDDCKLICKECKICVHLYSCSCLDNFVKGNICKHIHAICTIQNKTTNLSAGNVSKLENINEEPLQIFISDHNKMQRLESRSNNTDRLKTKLDLLYGYISHNSLSDENYTAIEKMLDVALSVAKNESSAAKSKEPSNKNALKQARFESTKRKRKSSCKVLSKPTITEKIELQQVLQENMETRDAIFKDHCYT